MTNVGDDGNWGWHVQSEGQLRAADLDANYFATHPQEIEYVRRVVPGEYQVPDQPDIAEAWRDVSWVLVVLMNEQRRARIRIPLREDYPQLTDGAEK